MILATFRRIATPDQSVGVTSPCAEPCRPAALAPLRPRQRAAAARANDRIWGRRKRIRRASARHCGGRRFWTSGRRGRCKPLWKVGSAWVAFFVTNRFSRTQVQHLAAQSWRKPQDSRRQIRPRCTARHSSLCTSDRHGKCPVGRRKWRTTWCRAQSVCTFHRHDPETAFRRRHELAGSTGRIGYRGMIASDLSLPH